MSDIAAILSPPARKRLAKSAAPAWCDPMLATLARTPLPEEGEWVLERKLDGVRCLVFREGKQLRLLSRNQERLDQTFPELHDRMVSQPLQPFVADGEIVAFEKGLTSFSRLQRRLHIDDREEARASRVAVYFYLFDLLFAAGYDLTELPLKERKKVLKRTVDFDTRIRFTPYFGGDPDSRLREACGNGWEGLIAKRIDAGYRHARSRAWLKLKCARQQAFVIGGYTAPHGARRGFGALLLGFYEGGALRYAGKVGTGFDDAMLRQLSARLRTIRRKTSPFAEEPGGKETTYVTPRLVAEVAYTGITAHEQLRHPRFLGLRRDKDSKDVTLERPISAPARTGGLR